MHTFNTLVYAWLLVPRYISSFYASGLWLVLLPKQELSSFFLFPLTTSSFFKAHPHTQGALVCSFEMTLSCLRPSREHCSHFISEFTMGDWHSFLV